MLYNVVPKRDFKVVLKNLFYLKIKDNPDKIFLFLILYLFKKKLLVLFPIWFLFSFFPMGRDDHGKVAEGITSGDPPPSSLRGVIQARPMLRPLPC